MASKVKKSQAKTPKSTVKKIGTATAASKKKVAAKKTEVKKAAPTKKVTCANIKKKPQKKVAASKTPTKKAAVVKKAVAKKEVAMKKTTSSQKADVAKQSMIKKPKTAAVIKKEVVSQKPSLEKPARQKPDLKIVVSNQEKTQPAKTVTTTIKIATEKAKEIVKGVKKKVMQSLEEVRIIKPSGAGLFGVKPYEEKVGEEYMNEAQKNHFREILWRWKRELMEEVDRTKSHMQDGAARHPDPSDNATQEEEFNLELRTRDRERKLIKKIDEALIRIDNDEYGYCDACGIDIGIRRLEARPTAEMCIDCKTLDEIKEKQTRA